MKKISIFLVSFVVFLFLASFLNQNKVFAECLPCQQYGSTCPATHPVDKGNGSCIYNTSNLPPYNMGKLCCDSVDDNDTCSPLSNYSTSYACKNACSGEGESESSLGNCPGTQKCCAFLTPPGVGGSTCRIDDDCLSRNCNNGKCEGGSVELVCNQTDTGFRCKTAIGTISTDVQGFSKSILQILLGLSGGILLVMIIINGYKIMTSQGDPEKIKDAREGIIAAIAGILLIIFSVSILQLITVDIIGIPGFKR